LEINPLRIEIEDAIETEIQQFLCVQIYIMLFANILRSARAPLSTL